METFNSLSHTHITASEMKRSDVIGQLLHQRQEKDIKELNKVETHVIQYISHFIDFISL